MIIFGNNKLLITRCIVHAKHAPYTERCSQLKKQPLELIKCNKFINQRRIK